ncbi:DUF1254 domain-containing protein [Kitasatospora sp. CM 4170]|uniref:DUF1254 domain-containing protein n=1 Tax=Kitasatospora aburaviensis TaxID=67265 RepID=A0ABW1EXG0_9ACTN|nr:DUF1254 domain-containing protein [Kitasatospora sp. CM 4170]WNM46455.1 DUF1254 domain-containing protein [Kitasatospora sp. CM 4170]
MTQPELEALAADAYVYGYPLVSDLTMVERFTGGGMGTLPAAPFNRMSHATRLAEPGDPFVSVNNDTVYSIAQLDLSEGPLVLHVPDTAGAYYVLQFVDAWTDNFAYVGSRATGTGEQSWLIVPPHWHGTPPDPGRVIVSPTTIASIVGRFACTGPDDLPRVQALQEALTLSPLEPGGLVAGLPAPDPDVPERLAFFERLRVWMAAFPPAGPDVEYQRRFAPLGLLDPDPSPYRAAAPEWTAALLKGVAAGRERVEDATRPPEDHPAGEWRSGLHLFDFNTDYLGPGTIDDPEWRIPDRRAAYLSRAAAARAGLWGNHAYEAVFAMTYDDADGRPLSGAHAYTLRFDEPPPAEAFWSLTMYGLPDYYLVANPIERYAIGDRTPGLVYGDDGSLTLLLQHEPPADPAAAANWLPTPEGGFRPIIRLYQPTQAVLDGTYRVPPIRRI